MLCYVKLGISAAFSIFSVWRTVLIFFPVSALDVSMLYSVILDCLSR